MRAGIIQSNYIPWRGYFDFIASVDLFIFYDDVQYTPRNWRNRNQIKTNSGLQWLTVPVNHICRDQKINETKINYNRDWMIKHIKSIKKNYNHSIFFKQFIDDFSSIINARWDTISELNKKLIGWIMKCLGIKTPVLDSATFNFQSKSTQKLIDLLEAVGADTYLSGPAAASYLDLDMFKDAGISLEYKTYDYAPYPQLYGDFAPNVSVLDLMFCMGDQATDYIKSRSPDMVVYNAEKDNR